MVRYQHLLKRNKNPYQKNTPNLPLLCFCNTNFFTINFCLFLLSIIHLCTCDIFADMILKEFFFKNILLLNFRINFLKPNNKEFTFTIFILLTKMSVHIRMTDITNFSTMKQRG